MSRVKKDAVKICMKLDREVYEELNLYCEKENLDRTAATEIILRKYLEKKKRNEQR